MPDLPALEVLFGVAQAGSVSGAARQVGITQQAASARIRSAEARTGIALVVRTPRGSALPPEGALITEWAARLLAAAAELGARLAEFHRNPA
jgi:molybdate transport repressor ModE-like protein